TGEVLGDSSNLLHPIQEANEIFPREVVDEQSDGRGDEEVVRGNAGNGKVQKARDNDSERSEQNGQERAEEADGELQANAQGHEKNIPKAPDVGHYGHGENDHALHGNGDVVDVAGKSKDGGD